MHLAEPNRLPVRQCNVVTLHTVQATVPGFAVQVVNRVKSRSKDTAASVVHEGIMHQPIPAATSKVSHLCFMHLCL